MKSQTRISVFFILVWLAVGPSIADSDSSSYSGVTALYTKDSSNEFHFLASAVFIEPDTLVTVAHPFFGLRDEAGKDLNSKLWFLSPKTKEFEPVTGYHTIDFHDDIALLKTSFQSKGFYPIDQEQKLSFSKNIPKGYDSLATCKSKHLSPLNLKFGKIKCNRYNKNPQLIIAGFPDGDFKVISAQMWNQYGDFVEGELFYRAKLFGLSGGAVFHAETGQLMGIVQSVMKNWGFFRFLSVSAIKKHLHSEPQNCRSQDCVLGNLSEMLEKAFAEKSRPDSAIIQHRAGWTVLGTTCLKGMVDNSQSCRADIALALFLRSAEQKYIPAYMDYCLLKLIRNADTVHEKDLFFCSAGAKAGNMMAMTALGLLYYYGSTNVAINYNQAKYWLSKASEKGGVFARLHLGLMYAVGQGNVPLKPNLALCLLTSLPSSFIDQYPSAIEYIEDVKREGYSCPKPNSLYSKSLSPGRN